MTSTRAPFHHKKNAQALSDIAGDILEPLFAKRGFSNTELIACWPEIAGEAFAEISLPEAILWPKQSMIEKGELAKLVVRIENGFALSFQQEWPRICERLNQMFGYNAIGGLKLQQGKLPSVRKKDQRIHKSLSESERNYLLQATHHIKDEALRDALQRLGKAVLSEHK
jgi:hypothetical protein